MRSSWRISIHRAMPGGAKLARMAPFSVFPTITMTGDLRWTAGLPILVLYLIIVTASDMNAPRTQTPVRDLSDGNGRLNTSALEHGPQWGTWKSLHRKSYVTLVEELERFVIWRANQAFIDYHNNYANKLGFTLRMNQFGDLVRRE